MTITLVHRLSNALSVCIDFHHMTHILGALHSVVVYPSTTEDVVKIVKVATKSRMPIIPYSGGTSLEGNTRGVSDIYTRIRVQFLLNNTLRR